MSETAKIVEDVQQDNLMKGINGTTFPINLTKKENGEHAFSNYEIITYDKYNGLELYITDIPILDLGVSSIYNVQLIRTVDDSMLFLDNKFLAIGTTYFRIGSPAAQLATEKN